MQTIYDEIHYNPMGTRPSFWIWAFYWGGYGPVKSIVPDELVVNFLNMGYELYFD